MVPETRFGDTQTETDCESAPMWPPLLIRVNPAPIGTRHITNFYSYFKALYQFRGECPACGGMWTQAI
jgi:hypothetical protein